ncbi:MAG: ankyrin repeat domain-containing protein [Armatimonadetes bacterium]|nr:ankyrin repeat domain-containing protein [Armatimonadota bacterium]
MSKLREIDRELLAAIREHSLARVERALKAGADPNARQGKRGALDLVGHRCDDIRCALIEAGAWDEDLRTSLVWAVGTGRLETVTALIERGADVNVDPPAGTPLQNAARAGHLEMVQPLIQAGVDVDVASGFVTPLTAALQHEHEAIALLLIEAGAEPDRVAEYLSATPLGLAAAHGLTAAVSALLGAGAVVDRKTSDVRVDKLGERLGAPESTPLALAAGEGHAVTVRALLAAGADPTQRDGEGLTVFARAASHPEVLAVFSELGLRESAPTADERLLGAAESGDRARAEQALRDGADPNTRDPRLATRGFTPLMLAAWGGHQDCVRVLLDAGAFIDLAEEGDPVRVRRMRDLEEKSLRRIGYTLGRPPLMLALERGHATVLETLLQAGASLERRDFLELSPLELAARKGGLEAVQRLLELGAQGPKAFLIAVEKGHGEVARYLLGSTKTSRAHRSRALLETAEHCDLALVEALLATGADIKSYAERGNALTAAAGASRYEPLEAGTPTARPRRSVWPGP